VKYLELTRCLYKNSKVLVDWKSEHEGNIVVYPVDGEVIYLKVEVSSLTQGWGDEFKFPTRVQICDYASAKNIGFYEARDLLQTELNGTIPEGFKTWSEFNTHYRTHNDLNL